MQDITSDNKLKIDELTLEERQNIVGFFSLLFKVDMRVNPHLYTNQLNQDDRHNNTFNP